MNRSAHNLVLRIVKTMNLALICVPFALCWLLYYTDCMPETLSALEQWTVVLLFAIFYFIFARIYDGFLISLNRISEMIYSQVLAFLVADGLLYIVICLMGRRVLNLWPGIACIAGQFALSVLWCVISHRWYFAQFSPQRTVIVYERSAGMEQLICEYGLQKKFDVQMIMRVEDCLDDLSILDEFSTVFLSGVHSHDRNIILKYCVAHDICLYMIPRIGDVIMSGAKPMHMFHLPILRVDRYSPGFEYLFLKRVFDIVFSGLAIVILSPFMLGTAIAIKAYDGGPALYKQVRLTKDGREFTILKFRSMRVDAEANGVARLSTGEKDDRITPVGRVIRKIRFDELPQLINILKGDLSIVGPRPERPEIAAQYCEEMPEFALRLQAKAGLTGYAQVYGQYNTTPYDKLQMDLMYIARPSFWADLKICFATVKILFLPESTEGVAVGQMTAMDHDYTKTDV